MERYILIFVVGIMIFKIPITYAQEVLTLEKCINLALENNHSIKIAEEKLIEANAKKQEAFGHFLPSLSVSASYNRMSEVPSLNMISPNYTTVKVQDLITGQPVIGAIITGAESFKYKMGQEDSYVSKLTLNQPLFTWGKIRMQYKYACLNYDLTEEEYRKVKNELIFNVEKSFYFVLLAQEFLKISEEAVSVMEKHYEAIQGFYKEGKVSTVDVSRVEVLLVNAKTKKIKAENSFKLAKKSLLNLINLKEDREWQIQGELKFKPEEINLEKFYKIALENSPEIKQLSIQKNIVLGFLKFAESENKPSLVFIANYQYQKPFYFENDWKDNWNAILALDFPFFNGFSDIGKIKQVKSQIEQLEITEDQLNKGIRLEIEKLCLDLQEAKERIQEQEINVKVAKDNLEIIQKRYEKGLVSDLDLRDTQLALTQAETEYSQALFDYNIALIGLEKATGKLGKQ